MCVGSDTNSYKLPRGSLLCVVIPFAPFHTLPWALVTGIGLAGNVPLTFLFPSIQKLAGEVS